VCFSILIAQRYSFLAFLLFLSLITAVQSSPSCNSFPKIFGGNLSLTNLRHIDAFNDYLAIAGETSDYSLIRITLTNAFPYLALTSISGGGKYYWAKAFT
jgi:hypothetical protein